MTGQRGQATIEAVVVFPLCLLCAAAIVQCGVVVRDRVAVSQAARRAAVAELRGADAAAAARSALPTGLRDDVTVTAGPERVEVSVRSHVRLLGSAMRPTLRSSVELAGGGRA